MGYVDVETGVGRWSARVPDDRADDAERLAAYATLAASAAPLYNASLSADDPTRALKLAHEAVRLFPYGPELLDYALTLSVHHGDFAGAAGLLRHTEGLGLTELAERHRQELDEALRKWNTWVGDPSRLRADLDGTPPERLGLRVRLALEKAESTASDGSLPGSSEPVKSHTRPRVAWVIGGVAAVLGVLIGLAIPRSGTGSGRSVAPTSLAAESRNTGLGAVGSPSDRVDRAAEAVRSGNLEASVEALEGESGPVADVLRGVVWQRAVEDSDAAWRRRDYEAVAQGLGTLADTTGAPSEALYRLAVAAHETNDASLAYSAAAGYLDRPEAAARDDRRAQTAFVAAASAPAREDALRYARMVRDSYGGTIYDNSTIRAILRDDDQR